MKLLSLAAGLILAATLIGTSAQAQNYPWCANYTGKGTGGARNCGFTSFAQCMATVSGIGGFCEQNNTYVPSARTSRRHHKQS
jgi:Protein of unknown function (DUF3551)